MPFWDERFRALAEDYPDVRTDQYHVDILTANFVLHPDWFDVRNHDVMYLLLGTGPDAPRLAFEIVGTETTSNIPPFTTRYITNRRDDLHIPAGG